MPGQVVARSIALGYICRTIVDVAAAAAATAVAALAYVNKVGRGGGGISAG